MGFICLRAGEYTIEEPSLRDCRAIAECHVASWQQAYRELLPEAFLASLSVPERESRWRGHIEAGSSRLLVARDEARRGEVDGFVAFGPSRDAGDADRAEVSALYVRPAAWSRGLGRVLWLAAASQLAAAGFTSVGLWVFAENSRAIRFYEKAGFVLDPASRTKTASGGVELDKVRYLRRW